MSHRLTSCLRLNASLVVVLLFGLGSAERPSAQPPVPPTPGEKTYAPAGPDDRQLIDTWARMRPAERMQRARQFLAAGSGQGEHDPGDPMFKLFTQAMEKAGPRDRTRLRRSRFPDRVRLLLEIVDRHVRSLMRRDIPDRLERMKKAGVVTEEEVREIAGIDNPRRQEKAYFDLLDAVFLRQMLQAGRIDEAECRRITGLSAGREKRRALDRIRRNAFLQVNAHLLHFLLKPAERVTLKATRLPETFYLRVMEIGRKTRVSFLPVFASQDPKRLSHQLRMTEAEERALTAEGVSAEKRDEIAQGIYHRQREAFLAALSARVGQEKTRFVAAADEPAAFYRRALWRVYVLEGPERRDENGWMHPDGGHGPPPEPERMRPGDRPGGGPGGGPRGGPGGGQRGGQERKSPSRLGGFGRTRGGGGR